MGWEKAGLRRDAVRSQVIDVLKAQEIKESVLWIGGDRLKRLVLIAGPLHILIAADTLFSQEYISIGI